MAYRLEGQIKRFIGTSSDVKPLPDGAVGANMGTGELLPAGSSFLESDTGLIYRWNGEKWMNAVSEDASIAILTAIYLEMSTLRQLLEIQLS